MNEGKQDLEGARLRQMLERSCCKKTNNERISLIWSCGVHLKLRDEKPATHGKRNLIGKNKEARNLFHLEDNEELGSFISTINSNNP